MTPNLTCTAVLPIKQLQNAKQRLGGLLNQAQRQHLFTAMVEDVLTAVETCPQIHRVVVITDDAQVAELAGGYGAEIWPEPEDPGLNQAVTWAGQRLAEEGITTMVFLPGDVPLVSADELEVVLAGFGRSEGAEFLIVPATDLGGSNCVACSPPDCMSFAFGVDSFRKHVAIARERGLTPQVAKLPGIGLDIDTPEDLQALLRAVATEGHAGQEYSTVRYLLESGIVDQLETGSREKEAETGKS